MVKGTDGATFLLKYDLEYNDFPLISLAATKDLTSHVACMNTDVEEGLIAITFNQDVDPTLLERMIPEGSLIVVDSFLFGPCDVATAASLVTETVHDGYLLANIVTWSENNKNVVSVVGEVASMNYFYRSKSIEYSRIDDYRRNLIGAGFKFSTSLHEPEDFVVQLRSNIEFSGHAFIVSAVEKWGFSLRSLQASCSFGYLLDSEIESSLVLKLGRDKEFKNYTKRYPVYELPIATAMKTVLRLFMDKDDLHLTTTGLFVTVHPKIAGKIDNLEARYELVSSKVKASTGEKEVRLSISGETGADIQFLKNEPASFNWTSETNKPNLMSLSASAELSLFGGFVIQMVFQTGSLARGSIGMQAGAYVETEIKLWPSPTSNPIVDVPGFPYRIGCDVCHRGLMSVNIGMSDPFLRYNILFDKEGEEKNCPTWS